MRRHIERMHHRVGDASLVRLSAPPPQQNGESVYMDEVQEEIDAAEDPDFGVYTNNPLPIELIDYSGNYKNKENAVLELSNI